VNESVPVNQRFDCCDTDRRVNPGQTTFFTEGYSCGAGVSFEYNCRNGGEPTAQDCGEFGLLDCPTSVMSEVGDCGAEVDGFLCVYSPGK
jgi:hypothetical protein